ncbi:MAG: DUF268 domain-containing protein [Minisyncoccia bacterium]
MGNIKKFIKSNIPIVIGMYSIYKASQDFIRLKFISFLIRIIDFTKDYLSFKVKLSKNRNRIFRIGIETLYPCLNDKLEHTPIDYTYFYQDIWFVEKILQLKPKELYDIGSSVKTLGIISRIVPVIFIDIRPPEIYLDNFKVLKGDITDLKLEDESIDIVSSLCVIEHIGLGRYGDKLNHDGDIMAIKEIKRVLKKGGIFLVSLPVDGCDTIYFNAHRAYTRDTIIEMFKDFEIIEEKYIYGNRIYDNYDKEKGFGTGLYMLRKKYYGRT